MSASIRLSPVAAGDRRRDRLAQPRDACMTNPYAPPAPAAFVLPTPVLPPGVRRFGLDPAAYRVLLQSRVRRRGPIIVAIVAVIIAINGLSGLPALVTSGVLV